jgi:3-oxoadipate enol-lactonase
MAFVDHADARIHWRSLGKGEPLVLIMGLGCTSAMWFRLAPRLAKRHRVILLDNRGVGQTEARHALVHRVSTMAADVAAVLDAAGEASAHVLGLSMGGMIAQQFAIDFPSRVRTLTLMATNCGGAHAVLAQQHIWQLLFSKGDASPEDSLAAMRPFTYASGTPDEVVEEDNLVRLAHYPTLRGYQAQLYGLMGWSSYYQLPRLRCPTLLLHGTQDKLIPPANAHLLAARIPGAKLIEMAGASHWLHSDQTARTVEAVLAFIGQIGSARQQLASAGS